MSNDAEHSAQEHPMPGKHARLGYLLLAYTTTGLGIAGVFLPLLPTTPFLLVAVWAAPKGSQRVHDWIYQQPRFARLLDDWQQQGAVPLGAKCLATAMMIASWSFLLWRDYHWGLVLGMSLFFMGIGLFLWTRPNPEP
ncbi:MAG: YbaN family protein [Gammaproteobacteria bacterium]